MLILQAATHQGHMRFKGSGRQCVANALAAIVQNTKLSTSEWKEPNLDYVLLIGDKIYMDSKERSGVQFLTVEDLPPTIENYAI